MLAGNGRKGMSAAERASLMDELLGSQESRESEQAVGSSLGPELSQRPGPSRTPVVTRKILHLVCVRTI